MPWYKHCFNVPWGFATGSVWHNLAQSRSQHHRKRAPAALRSGVIGALWLASCVGGPHPEPPFEADDSVGRPTVPVTTDMMGPNPPVGAGIPPSMPTVGTGAAGSSGGEPAAAGAVAPGAENAGCAPGDGGVSDAGVMDAGVIDAGADAAMPDCDDDAGM